MIGQQGSESWVRQHKGAAVALGSAAALAGLAAAVNWRARQAEREHPQIGHFIEVEGVRLHYIERGQGRPVVLLHGNASQVEDFALSIMAPLARRFRVIAIDRPGFGYSERPRDREWWDPRHQASLLRHAFFQLGIERPVILGHSWATLVALAFALLYPDEVAGVVVESGYYYPKPRPDIPLVTLPTLPVIGPVIRNTLWPLSGYLFGPLMLRLQFSPNPVPPTRHDFPFGLVLRPSTIHATVEDGSHMNEAAREIAPHYPEISVPVVILAGTGDKMSSYAKQAVRLRDDIPGSRLRIVPKTGHMLHHARPQEILRAVATAWVEAESRRDTEAQLEALSRLEAGAPSAEVLAEAAPAAA